LFLFFVFFFSNKFFCNFLTTDEQQIKILISFWFAHFVRICSAHFVLLTHKTFRFPYVPQIPFWANLSVGQTSVPSSDVSFSRFTACDRMEGIGWPRTLNMNPRPCTFTLQLRAVEERGHMSCSFFFYWVWLDSVQRIYAHLSIVLVTYTITKCAQNTRFTESSQWISKRNATVIDQFAYCL